VKRLVLVSLGQRLFRQIIEAPPRDQEGLGNGILRAWKVGAPEGVGTNGRLVVAEDALEAGRPSWLGLHTGQVSRQGLGLQPGKRPAAT